MEIFGTSRPFESNKVSQTYCKVRDAFNLFAFFYFTSVQTLFKVMQHQKAATIRIIHQTLHQRKMNDYAVEEEVSTFSATLSYYKI